MEKKSNFDHGLTFIKGKFQVASRRVRTIPKRKMRKGAK